MNKWAALFVLASLVITGCGSEKKGITEPKTFDPADFPNEKGRIYGRWVHDARPVINQVTETKQLYFNRSGEIGVVKICSYSTEYVTVSATIPAVVDEIQTKFAYKIDHTQYQKGSGSILGCEISERKSVIPFGYEIDRADRLTIINGVGGRETLTRIP